MPKRLYHVVILLLATVAICAGLMAQNGSGASPAQGYTLRANARAVLTDVVVLDKKGEPVHGLPASAFHLFDDKEPQRITSFEEHGAGAREYAASEQSQAGVYSNSILQHPPAVLNVMVLDILNLPVPDQMYLSEQVSRFLDRLPAGVPLSVYLHENTRIALVQDFTTDRAKLLDAVHRALPHLPPLGGERSGDAFTLHQIATDLAQYPGRKNVLWFSGGSRLTLNPVGMVTTPSADFRLVYDELETGRIAIYPIDARGLLTMNAFGRHELGGRTSGDDGPVAGSGLFAQHGLMQDVAEATGGLAFYNTNGLSQAAAHVVNADEDFYTLSYSPSSFHYDNKWHQVKVQVDSEEVQVSYRRGYFADSSHADTPADTRTRLLAGSRTVTVDPLVRSAPIIFRATVTPMRTGEPLQPKEPPVRQGQTRYRVSMALPSDAFTKDKAKNGPELKVNFGLMAMNRDGTPLVRMARRVTFGVNEEQLRRRPDTPIPVDTWIDLNKGETYLYFAVWDSASGRFGTLNIPLQVP